MYVYIHTCSVSVGTQELADASLHTSLTKSLHTWAYYTHSGIQVPYVHVLYAHTYHICIVCVGVQELADASLADSGVVWCGAVHVPTVGIQPWHTPP